MLNSVTKVARNPILPKSCEGIIEHGKLLERIRCLEEEVEILQIQVEQLLSITNLNKKDL